jgi:hypothetical protein
LSDDLPALLKKARLRRPRQGVQVADALALVQAGVKIRDVSIGVRFFFDATAIRLKQQVFESHP